MAQPPPHIRVLLIDDEPDQLQLSLQGLRGNGEDLEATTVSSGLEALDLMRMERFDCVVSDYSMPKLNGIQLCRKIRQKGDTTPFILYTARGSEQIAEKAFKVGVDLYLRKESNMMVYSVLAKQIHTLVTKHRAEEALKQSEERFRALVTASTYALYSMSPDWKEMRQLDGKGFLKDTETPSISWLDEYIPAEEQPRVLESIRRAIQTRTMFQLEYKVRRADGSLGWTLSRAVPLLDEDGEIREWFGAASDITERKEAEERLAESNEELRALEEELRVSNESLRMHVDALEENQRLMSAAQEIARLGSWELDVASNKLYWSDEVYRIFGLSPSEFEATYSAFLEAVHPDDRKYVDQAYSGSLLDGSDGYEIDHRIIRRLTGDVRYVHEKCDHIRDRSGKVIRSIGFVQDVTESKLLEDKLFSSLERLSESEEELSAMNEELHASNEELAAMNEELTASGDELRRLSLELEERVEERTKELSKINKMLSAEVEERKHAEQSLKVEEERLDALLRLSKMSGASLKDVTGFTLEQAIALTGSRVGFVGFLNEDESVYTLHAVSRDVVKECSVTGDPLQWHVAGAGIWADAIRQRKTLFVNDYDKPYPNKKGFPPGHPYLKKFMIVPILVNGKIVSVAGVGDKSEDYDKSDERQVTLLLNGMWSYLERIRAMEILEEAKRLDAVDRISAMVAHDVRSPLITAAQALNMASNKPERSDEMLSMAMRNIDRAIKMIEELRANTRLIEAKRMSVDLENLIMDTANKPLEDGVRLELSCGEGLNNVSLDPGLIRRVLENLLSNAVEALPGGGVVKVDARREGGDIVLSVSDNGVGIQEESRKDIFTPLYTTKTKGVGLGLSFCKRAVEAHGGSISFTSEPDHGTTFTVKIPLNSD